MKNTKTFDLKTLDSLSLKELRAINNAVFAAMNRAERKADKEKTTSRLVAVEPERWQASATDRKRFAGGFFREQRPSGNLGGRLYAETKTGILYVQDRFGKTWEKVV